MSRLFLSSLLILFISCDWHNDSFNTAETGSYSQGDSLRLVSDIPPPAGYYRETHEKNSFAEWLRNLSLKRDNRVYLYNGELKRRQSAHFAVLDVTVGNKDLQQCADAVMRLRAEYLFSRKRFSEIVFRDNANKAYKWTGGSDYSRFPKYLETVFGMCGSASLEKQLKPVSFPDIHIGDVLIKGGFPGHAMIVVDIAQNARGKRLFMLAQSYMPAQDIHIVRNPANPGLSPWYEVSDEPEIDTPEWTFYSNQFRSW